MKNLLKKIFKREKKEDSPEVKRKKMIIFFGFYFFFFLFLFIWMRSYSGNTKVEEQKENTEIIYKTDMIENNNYTYVYEIEEDDKTYTFKGIRDDESYEVSEYKYKFFLDIYNIKKLIKNSKYLYKTDNNNEISYKYEIDNKTLSNMLQDGKNLDNGINNIIVYVDSTNNAYKIELDFSNYMRSIEEYQRYHLTLYYGVGE
jgi:hypothetical protein